MVFHQWSDIKSKYINLLPRTEWIAHKNQSVTFIIVSIQ